MAKSIEDIQKSFTELQDRTTKLSNKKIGLESEIKTLETDLKEKVETLNSLTGQSSLPDSIKYFEEKKADLETKKDKIYGELKDYLDEDEMI